MMAMAAAMAQEEEKETDNGYEKTYTDEGNMVHEAWDKKSKSGEYSVVLGKRFTVKANLTNATNKYYADSLYTAHYIPGAERTLQVSLIAKF